MSYPEPRHLGEDGEASARFRPAGSDPDLLLPATTVRYLITGGDVGLYRWDMGRRLTAVERTAFLRAHDQYMVGP